MIKTIHLNKEESMKKKKKSNKFLIRRIVALLIMLLIIFGIRDVIYHIWNQNQIKQTRLLFNNKIMHLSNPIYVEDSVLYLSEEDIKNIFDETIYYNVGDKELITTYNKHVAVLHLNEKQVIVNDSNLTMQGELKEVNSQIYLPISDLSIVYDIETEYAESTNMVIINATTKSKKQMIALKDAKIKASKLPFSRTIEKVKRGDDLYLIEESRRYKKVRTSSGNIGYIQNGKISDPEVLREDLIENTAEINILEGYSDFSQNYGTPELKQNKDNVVLIEDFSLTKDSKINSSLNTETEEYKNYFNWTEENQIQMIAQIKNESTVSTNFATYEQRNRIINEIYQEVMKKQYKGICINFEKIDDINSFHRFLIELTPKFKESGLKVMVKLNEQIDQEKVKNIVDFII